MTTTRLDPARQHWRHPLHLFLVISMVPLFLGALLSDIAYARTYEIQWTNFAAWLNAGALVFCGLSLAWALVDLLRLGRRTRRSWLYVGLLLGTFVLGFIGALIHAKDAWASMPGALIVSIIVAVLSVVTVWMSFDGSREGASL